MLTTEERERIEILLAKERTRTLESLSEFDRSRETSVLEEAGDPSMYRLHPADVGTDVMEQEKQFLLASVEGRRLVEIDDALQRLIAEPEQFGVCQQCGREIGFERLEVIPYATLCTECQIAAETLPAGG